MTIMYRKYEVDGFHLEINDRFISKYTGKPFIEIGSKQELVGKIERDNIVLEITYMGFGKLIHKRTNQSYNDLLLSKDQWEKVKAHFTMYPTYYCFQPIGLDLCIYEAGIEVKRVELPYKQIEPTIEEIMLILFVQHVACKPAAELNEIRKRSKVC